MLQFGKSTMLYYYTRVFDPFKKVIILPLQKSKYTCSGKQNCEVSDVKNLATAFVYFLCPSNYEILPRSYMRQEIVDVGNIFLDYKNTSARKKIKIISNFSYGNSFHIKSNETKRLPKALYIHDCYFYHTEQNMYDIWYPSTQQLQNYMYCTERCY